MDKLERANITLGRFNFFENDNNNEEFSLINSYVRSVYGKNFSMPLAQCRSHRCAVMLMRTWRNTVSMCAANGSCRNVSFGQVKILN